MNTNDREAAEVTRPSDRAIAEAFRQICESNEPWFDGFEMLMNRARELDRALLQSPAAVQQGEACPNEVCDCERDHPRARRTPGVSADTPSPASPEVGSDKRAAIRRLNFSLWMTGSGGCEPPTDWQEGYRAGMESTTQTEPPPEVGGLVDAVRVRDALMVLRSEETFLRVVHGDDTADDHMGAVETLTAALSPSKKE